MSRRTPAPVPEPVRPARRLALLGLALALLVFAAYGGVARNGFVDYDDPDYITDNPHVRAGLTLETVAWAFRTGYHANWHPLTWLSHALDYELFGADPAGHHLVSVALHALNAILLLLVLERLTSAPWRSAVVAALFALHPLHVESVAWAAERKDVLSTCFGLLAMLSWAGGVIRPTPLRRAATPLLFALSLMSKPMLVTLPFLLLLLDFWPLGRWRIDRAGPARWLPPRALLVEKLPLFALAAASSLVTWLVQRAGGAVSGLEALPVGSRLANAAVAYVAYLARALWPVDLAVLYPLQASPPAWEVAGAWAVLAGLTVAALALARRAGYVPVGWFWYLGALVPVIGLVQVGVQASADRYTYLPLVGVFVLAVWGLPDLLGRRRHARAALAATAVLVLASCAALTWRQVGFWRSSLTLFEHALEVTADNHVIHNNLGGVLMRMNRLDEAVAHFEAARRIRPDYASALSNLGLAAAQQGRLGEATELFHEALKSRPDHVEAWLNLADARQRAGDPAGAIAAVREAQRLRAGDPVIEAFAQALARLPGAPRPRPPGGRPEARAQLDRGHALRTAGRLAEAESAYREALRLDPALDAAHNNLGILLALKGQPDQAADEFRAALRLAPRDATVHLNLGTLLARSGRLDEAIAHFEEALRLQPGQPQAEKALVEARRRRQGTPAAGR